MEKFYIHMIVGSCLLNTICASVLIASQNDIIQSLICINALCTFGNLYMHPMIMRKNTIFVSLFKVQSI